MNPQKSITLKFDSSSDAEAFESYLDKMEESSLRLMAMFKQDIENGNIVLTEKLNEDK